MAIPLVLKNGIISEELVGEIGTYPRLRILAGALVAGGIGKNLKLVNGSIVEYSNVIWDVLLTPATVWDGGLSEWT